MRKYSCGRERKVGVFRHCTLDEPIAPIANCSFFIKRSIYPRLPKIALPTRTSVLPSATAWA